jgi:hypothetical protein
MKKDYFWILTALALLFFWAPRIFLGVDFTDESFPLAVTKHLSYGAKLFVDEVDIHQTTAPYLYPFYLFFSFLSPKLEGLFLFFRFLPVLFMAAICWNHIRKPEAQLTRTSLFVLLLPLLTYAPGPANGIIYSVGSYLAWTALILSDPGQLGKKSLPQVAAVGALAGIVTGFYLTPVAVFSVTAIVLLALRKISFKQLAYLAGGFLAGLLPLLCFLLNSESLSHLADVVYMNTQLHYPFFTQMKWNRVMRNSNSHLWELSFIPLGMIVSRFLPRFCRSISLFATALVFSIYFSITGSLSEFQSDCLVLAVWLLVTGIALADSSLRKRIGNTNWLMTLALALTTGYTTNARGILTFCWVFAPLCTLIFIEMAKDTETEGRPKSRYLIFASMFILSFGTAFSHAVFNYDPLSKDLALVEKGPYRYIWAHPNKVNYLKSVSENLEAIPANSSVFIYYNFPAGYLITNAEPRSNFLWAFYDFNDFDLMNQKMTDYFDQRAGLPDYVVEMKYLIGKRTPVVPFEVPVPAENHIHKYLTGKHYKVIDESPILTLYKVEGK